MKAVFIVEGQDPVSVEFGMPVTFAIGQGYVHDDEAYVVVAVSTVGDVMRVDLEPQTYCDDCGMAKVSPSILPFCICNGPIE